MRLEDLPLNHRILVERHAKLRAEVHHASSAQEHGIHLIQRTAHDSASVLCRSPGRIRVLGHI